MSLFDSDIDVDMYDLESVCDPRHLTEFSLSQLPLTKVSGLCGDT
jgi:hypothetical protein